MVCADITLRECVKRYVAKSVIKCTVVNCTVCAIKRRIKTQYVKVRHVTSKQRVNGVENINNN